MFSFVVMSLRATLLFFVAKQSPIRGDCFGRTNTALAMTLFFHLPQLAHFLAGGEQFVQRAFGFYSAIFQHDDVIGAA